MIEFELPFPPSVNHMWRRVGQRTLISRAGRAFRGRVCAIVAARRIRPMNGPLAVRVEVFPPDHRRRDLDNLPKAVLDALQHGGAYYDDSQIDRLLFERRYVVPEGKVRVRLDVRREEPAEARQVKAKRRTCLKCGKLFDSAGPGNRICERCGKINNRVPITEEGLKKQRGLKRRNGEIMCDPPTDDIVGPPPAS